MEEYKSLNFETGMLYDIDEIRRFGVDVAQALQEMLKNPVLRMSSPPDLFYGLVTYAVKAESFFRVMSQREQFRLMNKLTGTPEAVVDSIEKEVGGLSDLPATHPQALGRLLENIRSSNLPEEVKREANKKYEEAVDLFARTELPQSIEGFIQGLLKEGE